MKNNKPIYVTKSFLPPYDDFIEEIKPIFDTHILTNMGPLYKKLQHQLIQYLDVKELSLFVNGHMALEMAIDALGLKEKGGEVITTPFTFVSTTHAITRNGLKPVFCDIKPNDYTMDPKKIEALITNKTVAIIPVHVYGRICDVDAIEQIAKKHNLVVIYDAAHAFGVKYRNVGIGNYGDASMFSFHATKVFNTIEGGAIAFADKKYGMKLHELKNFGIHSPEDVLGIGGNAKLDEFRAAMGICNLRYVDECIKKRKAVYDRYCSRLGKIDGVLIPLPQVDVTSNYSYFPIYINSSIFGCSRDIVFEELSKNNIFTRKYFYPAVNDMACYDYLDSHDTPIAHDAAANILTLPLYPDLSLDDVDLICDVIIKLKVNYGK